MSVLLYVTEGLFALLGAGVLLGSIQSKRVGLLLPAATYVLSAVASFALQSWWPLFLGFGLARLFGSMGVGAEPQPVQRPTAKGLLLLILIGVGPLQRIDPATKGREIRVLEYLRGPFSLAKCIL